MAEPELALDPIFLLGAGRCGSTFQQVRLCETGNVWIWGEHSGVLAGLFRWGGEAANNRQLTKYVYPREPVSSAEEIETLQHDGRGMAWMNGFRRPDLMAAQRALVLELFAKRLPPGKTRWGFKEIRYGPADRVPLNLLRMFPAGRIVHTVRAPFASIESAIVAWELPTVVALVEQNDQAALDALYLKHLDRWNGITGYLLDLQERWPRKVRTSRIEHYEDERRELFAFLSLEAPTGSAGARIFSKADTASGYPRIARAFAERRERFEARVAANAGRAGYG